MQTGGPVRPPGTGWPTDRFGIATRRAKPTVGPYMRDHSKEGTFVQRGRHKKNSSGGHGPNGGPFVLDIKKPLPRGSAAFSFGEEDSRGRAQLGYAAAITFLQ